MAQFIRVRKIKRKPVRIGTVNVSGAASGSLINLDDVASLRDLRNTDWNNLQVVSNQLDRLSGGSPLVSNMPVAAAAVDQAANTTTKLWFTPIQLQAGDLVTGLKFWAGATAGATLTGSWAGVFTYDGTTNYVMQAVSANTATASWAANTSRTFNMGTPYLVATSGVFLAGLVIIGTTMPTLISNTVATATFNTNVWGVKTGAEGTAVRTTTPPALGAAGGTIAVVDVTASAVVPFFQVV